MKYYTADSHFSLEDYSVIARDYRPFESLKAMNEGIIKIWNSQANENDVIYHLGDFINYNYRDKDNYKLYLSYVKKIKAKVILILGNNEKRLMENEFGGNFENFKSFLLKLGFFDVVEKGLSMEIGGKIYYLNHFPCDCDKDGNNLFAHVHKSVFVKKYGFNVGVDNHYFKLFNEEDIVDLESRRMLFDENVYD